MLLMHVVNFLALVKTWPDIVEFKEQKNTTTWTNFENYCLLIGKKGVLFFVQLCFDMHCNVKSKLTKVEARTEFPNVLGKIQKKTYQSLYTVPCSTVCTVPYMF